MTSTMNEDSYFLFIFVFALTKSHFIEHMCSQNTDRHRNAWTQAHTFTYSCTHMSMRAWTNLNLRSSVFIYTYTLNTSDFLIGTSTNTHTHTHTHTHIYIYIYIYAYRERKWEIGCWEFIDAWWYWIIPSWAMIWWPNDILFLFRKQI